MTADRRSSGRIRRARALPLFLSVLAVLPALSGLGSPCRGEAAPAAPAVAADPATGRPAGGTAADSIRPPAVSWKAGLVDASLNVDPDSLRLRLPTAWVRPETFSLAHGDTLLARGVDFLLDPRQGTVRLLRGFPRGTVLRARYASFPVALAGEFSLHPMRAAGPRDLPDAAPPAPTKADPEPGAHLDLSGSKTFAMEVGTQQDLGLKQSLDLTVLGNVSRDVSVKAILTDRQTPLQPEGTSTTLEDLDRVLVEVEGPLARMTLGDFPYALAPTEFVRYSRQLQGAQGSLAPRTWTADAIGATTPGALQRVEFTGQEGKQGPYRLTASGFDPDRVIVAGSERVTLDGRRMTRGEGEDYIVDYAQGTLTFTGRRPITAYSEITVDFQISAQRFRRSVYGGGASLAAGHGWSWTGSGSPASGSRAAGGTLAGGDARPLARILFLNESDNRSRPVVPLGGAQRAALARAGDDTTGLSSGVRFVGYGQGDYERLTVDSLATSFFRYMGPDSGSYRVRFVDVGEKEGDYADSTLSAGAVVYVYRGQKKGRFVPAEELTAPERTSIASLSLTPQWRHAALKTEYSVSDHDANTYSPIGDQDNVGHALLAEGALRDLPAGPLRAGLRGGWREIGSRFHSLDPLDPSFYTRDWNVDASRLRRGDRRRNLGADLSLGRQRLSAVWEDLDNRSDFNGRRVVLDGQGAAGPVLFTGRLLRARTSDLLRPGTEARGRRLTESLGFSWLRTWGTLTGSYARERNEQGSADSLSGAFFREGGIGFSTSPRWTRWKAGLDWRRRVRWVVEGDRTSRLDRGDTGQASLDWQGDGGNLLSLVYSDRRLVPESAKAAERSQLGQVRWVLRGAEDAAGQEGRFELSTAERQRREREIRFVGDGQGHYDSLGVYQGIGDYEVFTRGLADSLRTQKVVFSLRSELDLSRLAGAARTERSPAQGAPEEGSRGGSAGESGETPGMRPLPRSAGAPWFRTLHLLHYWAVHLESDRALGELWPDLPASFLGKRDHPLLEMVSRFDLSALPRAKWLAPRVRWEERRNRQASTLGAGDKARTSIAALALRSRPLSRWTAEQEVEWEIAENTPLSNGLPQEKDGWRSLRVRFDQSASLGRSIDAGLDLFWRRRHRVNGEETADVGQASPYVTWSVRPRGRFEIRTARTLVSRSGGGTASRELEQPGWNSRALATIRIREELDLTLWLREVRPDHQAVRRDGRAELRISF